MRRSKLLIMLSTFVMVFGMASCSPKSTIKDLQVVDASSAKKFKHKEFFNFQESQPVRLLSVSDGYSNNGAFGSTWSSDAVTYSPDNGLSLSIFETGNPSEIKSDSQDPYISGEIRTAVSYKYGFFGTYMKPAKATGTASTFFLYSGNPHDEIDIEFLGKDTTHVQFNYFKNGVGGHEYMYDLGFDASEEYHHYGIYWGKTEICWYVDGEAVYRIKGEEKDCPSAKCQLICNIWSGASTDRGVMSWMGHVNPDDLPAYTSYKSFEIADMYGAEVTVKPKGKEYDVCPSDSDLVAVSGTYKSCSYTTKPTTSPDGSFELVYNKSEITKNYLNVKVDFEGIANKKWAQIKLQNLNNENSLVRLTVDTKSDAGTSSSTLLSIWKNGTKEQVKISNSTEGHFELNANETAYMTVRWYGEGANELTFMFDDFGDMKVVNGQGLRSGHVKVSDYKFGGVQDFVPEDHSGDVVEYYTKNGEIEDSASDQVAIPAGFNKVNIPFNNNSYYTVTTDEEGQHVAYSVAASNYEALQNNGPISFGTATEVIFVIKNNNLKEEYYQLYLRDSANKEVGLITSSQVISASSTGRYDRVSSSHPGVPYFYVAAGRTCQIKFTISAGINDMKLIAAVGGAATEGSFVIKGIYANGAQE